MITIQDGPGLDGGPGSAQDAASPDVGTRHRVSAETQRGPGCGEHGPSHGGPEPLTTQLGSGPVPGVPCHNPGMTGAGEPQDVLDPDRPLRRTGSGEVPSVVQAPAPAPPRTWPLPPEVCTWVDGKPVRARCPVCGKPRGMHAGWLAEHGPLAASCEGSGLRVFPPTPFLLHDLRAVAS